MSSPSVMVLVRMLEPWLVRARMRLKASNDGGFTTSASIWLQWSVPKGGDFTVEDIEAMELLELLARVDFRAAWKLMLDITNETVYLDQIVDAANMGDEDAVYACFEIIGLQHALVNSTVSQSLRLLLLEIDLEEHSAMYYPVRQTLLQCLADSQQPPTTFTRGVNQRIQLKLYIDTVGLQVHDAERLLDDVATAVMLTEHSDRLELYPSWQKSVGQRISALSRTFEVSTMSIESDSTNVTDAQLLSVKSVWEDTHVAVDWIGLDSADDRLSPAMTAKFVRSMLATTCKGTEPSRLKLSAGCGMNAFEAACSALVTSQGLPYVSFYPANRLFWAWIAYAISSCDAAHQISHVRIDAMTLTEECVDVFEGVVKANDPLAVVWKCLNGQKQDGEAIGIRAVVDIGPRATLLLPRERGKFHSGAHVETLQVVEDSVDTPHVCVLYPGIGPCWVHRSQIIRRQEMVPQRSSRPEISRLHLEVYSATNFQALTRLLPSIGTTTLQQLEISGIEGLFLDNAFFGRLFQACPRLRRLDLVSIEVTDLDWLQVHGTEISTLAVIGVQTRDHDSYTRFLDWITGLKASALVKLHIQLTADELQDLMADIERMLNMNRRLERILLSVFTDETDVELVKTLSERFVKHSGMHLATRRAPLPLKMKLAFLSTSCTRQDRVNSSHVSEEPPAMAELKERRVVLDAEVVSMIFRFAAPCTRRFCGFVNSVATYSATDDVH